MWRRADSYSSDLSTNVQHLHGAGDGGNGDVWHNEPHEELAPKPLG